MSAVKTRCQAIAAVLPDLRDVFAVAGLGMVFYGTRMIFEPAAWIVVGAALFAMAMYRAG